MKILIVASYNHGRFAPFVVEQVEALQREGCEVCYYGVQGKGIIGYLKNLKSLNQKIKQEKPDIVHAHYGLCGVLANLQRKVPVVTTYHGSDLNNKKIVRFSKIAMRLSKKNIFVFHHPLLERCRNGVCIPCGVNIEDYPFMEKSEARKIMGLDQHQKYVLFSSAFDNKVKNYPLAKQAVSQLSDVELLELKGYTRKQVATLMYAVDVMLMTSDSEGSPQVIKEAMVCGCPIVSVDVGDVKQLIEGIDGCYIVDCLESNIIVQLNKALSFSQRTNGYFKILDLGLENHIIAKELIKIYTLCIKKK